MVPLHSAQQVREADRFAIDSLGIPGTVLMEHAALAVVATLKRRFGRLLPQSRGVCLAGMGNNGGDALAVARILYQRGVRQVVPVLLGDPARLRGDAALQFHIVRQLGIPWLREPDAELMARADWVVDGMFGTGLTREVGGEARRWIEGLNARGGRSWVVAADVPSGLCADTGAVRGVAVRADETVTFGWLKKGLVTGRAADHVGRIRLAHIQIPPAIAGIPPEALWWERQDFVVPPRLASGHKGNYGHVYVVAGAPRTQGAAVLTGLGALRVGAGLVSLVGAAETLQALRPRLPPELMTRVWSEKLFTESPPTVVAIGPGLGTDAHAWKQLNEVLAFEGPVVLDADALNLLSAHRKAGQGLLTRRKAPTIMTPHPKEAARLVEQDVAWVQQDRYRALGELKRQWQAAFILKGKGALVGGPGGLPVVVSAGDSGLSKGGSGDVLTGAVAGLIAQGGELVPSLAGALYLEGRASERITQRRGSGHGTLATELAQEMACVLGELSRT